MTHWKRFMKTGFAPIDAEHEQLASSLGQFVAAVNAGKVVAISASIKALGDQFAAHFAHEEQLMGDSNWCQLDRHREAHDLFLADVKKQAAGLQKKGFTNEFRQWAVTRILEWFRLHIMTNDVGLGQFLIQWQSTKQSPRKAQAG